MTDGLGRVLVVVPTYDERDNLRPVVGRLLVAVPDAHLLVVDDSSPDGTGKPNNPSEIVSATRK